MILAHTHGHLMPKKYPTPVPFVFGVLLILGGCATTEGPSLVPAAEMRVNERGQKRRHGLRSHRFGGGLQYHAARLRHGA